MLMLTQLFTDILHCLQPGRDGTPTVECDSRAVHKRTGTATQEQASPDHVLWGSNPTQRHASLDRVTECLQGSSHHLTFKRTTGQGIRAAN